LEASFAVCDPVKGYAPFKKDCLTNQVRTDTRTSLTGGLYVF